ncbi:MAG TPA: hypothetical protein PKD91_06495 [Bacteroidia bacterium]|nr:hypothetical protein [Bacteroidia bacterium]
MQLTEQHSGVNPNRSLLTPEELVKQLNGKWIEKNTAILIVHGIGDQKPLESLDQFARGFKAAMVIYGGHGINLHMSHQLVAKKSGDESYYWFDNYIRISLEGNDKYLDIYEYYWANRTENKVDIKRIFDWLRKVTSGAKKYYEQNKTLSTNMEDRSAFIDKEKGFNSWNYWFVIYFLGSLATILSLVMKMIFWLIKLIPVIGAATADAIQSKLAESITSTANILGDITIYNEVNPRSELYCIRKDILNGAVKAIRFLVEPVDTSMEKTAYDRVVVAGHSLGSQISFDAINRLTHQINLGELNGYNKQGNRINSNGNEVLSDGKPIHISEMMDRYFTFGSPLDKIAFFLREQCEDDQYLRIQMLQNFHCFKQRTWNTEAAKKVKLSTSIVRQFDHIPWVNYYHGRDYVSGSLDYYHPLTNVQCNFPDGVFGFTHSNYWYSEQFFGDVMVNVIGK